MADGLPQPQSMRNKATKQAKIDEGDLPIGGAPPVQMPNFGAAEAQRRAVPAKAEEQMPQRQKRSPSEIRSDFEKAAAVVDAAQKGGPMPQPTNDPAQAAPLPDAAPWAAPKKGQSDASPASPESGGEEEGTTFGDLDDFQWGTYHDQVQEESDFRRPELQVAVEGRCEDIDVGRLILYESVEQRQIIIPGKLEVLFRSLTAEEDMAIKEMMWGKVGSDRYILDTLTLMHLSAGLKAFNDAELLDHIEYKEGHRTVNQERFKEKMAVVMKLPIQIVSLLSVCYSWFDRRIRKELVEGVLGKS